MNRGVGGAVATVLAGLVCLGAVSAAAVAPTTVAEDELPVEVLITSITPRVLSPGDDLHLRGTVHNTGTTTIAEPRVLVHLNESQFISRYSLDRWRGADPQGYLGSRVLTVDLPTPLPPAASLPFDLVVPAASVPFPSRRTSWGARGLAVQVIDGADPAGARIGVTRAFALWFPEQEVTATRISVLVPVTGPPLDPAGAWEEELESSTRPDGRLAALLAATGEHSEVTWVVDPWLVEATSAADGSAGGWGTAFADAMTDREVHLLPYTDSDLAALAHAGAADLLSLATDRAHEAASATALPDGARVALAWPADPLPDQATASLANRDRPRALVVGPGQLQPPAVLTYTPSGRTEITVSGSQVTVLVPDERLSGALVTGQVQPFDGSPLSSTPVTPAVAAQDLLAELAVITRERPADGRHMLLTVPRGWVPDPELTDAQLTAVLTAPWVRAEPVTALIGATDPEIDRGTLPTRVMVGTEVSSAALADVDDAVSEREELATMVADPDTVLGDLELERLAPTAVAWRSDPTGRAEAVAASAVVTEALRSAVLVDPEPAINLVSTSGDIPVQVTNTLDEEVSVQVGLRPGDRRLVADEMVAVVVPPGAQVTVPIPVHAVQSANIDVVVELFTPRGVLIDDGVHFTVRVRAEWEGIGTAVIGALLALALVIGLIRTIRRGRTASRAEPQAQAGPDTLSPEEEAEQEDARVEAELGAGTGPGVDAAGVRTRDDDRPRGDGHS